MRSAPEHDRNDLALDALEYLLGAARGDDLPFEQRLLSDPSAGEALADLVLLKQAAAGIDEDVVPRLPLSPSRTQHVPTWLTTLAGLAAMLLVGLWLGYQWGDREEEDGRPQGLAHQDPRQSDPAAVVWQTEVINAWSELSDATDPLAASEDTLSEDELDAAYEATLSNDFSSEAAVPEWMWAAVSISAMDEHRESPPEDDFEFEETL